MSIRLSWEAVQDVLPPIQKIRYGDFSDLYFINTARVLEENAPEELVTMQVFNRHRGRTMVAGIEIVKHLLKEATGRYMNGKWISKANELEVWAVDEGTMTEYGGDPLNVQPVMMIRGQLQYFTILETLILGILARCSRTASQVYDLLEAADGMPLSYFGARFESPQNQALDGYGYYVAVEHWNDTHPDKKITPSVATRAGIYLTGDAMNIVGTMPHALIATMGSTVAAALAYCETMPVSAKRTVLVDFTNDVKGETLAVMSALWERYLPSFVEKRNNLWRLDGVRVDTSKNMIDKSCVQPGVHPEMILMLRKAIDWAYLKWEVADEDIGIAKEFCQNVQILPTGGFNADKIQRFRDLPIGGFAVGSSIQENDGSYDFTADVVERYNAIDDQWERAAKVGRRACWWNELYRRDLKNL